MKQALALFAIAIIAACSSLPDTGSGIVALQILVPDSAFVIVDSGAVTVHARALDINGDSVAATILWHTPDTAFVNLDTLRGIMTGKAPGLVRLQASVGTLTSDPVNFMVRAPDTTTKAGLRRPR